jgi:hypothetical protein
VKFDCDPWPVKGSVVLYEEGVRLPMFSPCAVFCD